MSSSMVKIMKKLGSKLRALRNRNGLTIRQLGDLLGVNNSYITKLESGEKKPSADLVLKIARLFNESTDALMKDEIDLN
jgi:transcriptional regulator with XRE-family HTH domain